jgi:hypothetical protein
MMDKAGFLDRLGKENVCANIELSLARAREILGLPPAPTVDPLGQAGKSVMTPPTGGVTK